MPLCHYVILDHCQSEMSQDCDPFFVLLELDWGTVNSTVRVFSVPNIRESLREMAAQRQDWILGILSDICGDCRNSVSLNKHNRLEQFYSLGVGPLRTSVSGSIDIDPDDDPLEIIRKHVQNVDPQRYLRNNVFSLEKFVELADDLTGTRAS